MKLSNYLKKSISTGLGNSLGSALVSIVFIPLIIQRIGMERYGTWAVLFIFIGISSVADLGLSKSLVYFIPKQKSQKEINEVYSAGFCLNTLMVLFVAIAGLMVYWSGVNVWGSNESISYELGRKILLYGLIITCCSLATSFYRSVLEAFYKIHLVSIGFLFLTVLNYVSIYVLSFFTDKVEHLIINTTAVYVLIFIFHLVAVRLSTTAGLQVLTISTIKGIVKYTFGFFSIGVLTSLMLAANRYLIVVLAGQTGVYGAFDVGMKISTMALGCLQAFTVPLFSVFSGYGKERISRIKQILKRYLIGLGGCYILGCLSFFIIGKHILDFVLKGESTGLFNVSLILILGISFFGVAEPFNRALWALGDLRLCFQIKVMQIVTNFSLIIVLANLAVLYRLTIACSLAFAVASVFTIVAFKIKYAESPTALCADHA